MNGKITLSAIGGSALLGIALFVFDFGAPSASDFAAVTPGMTEQQVVGILGEPTVVTTNAAGVRSWIFRDFWKVQSMTIEFETNGVVSATRQMD